MITRTDLLIIEGFLDPDTCRDLASAPMSPPPGRHDVNAAPLYGTEVAVSLGTRISEVLADFYSITDPLVCDYLAASQSLPGMGHVEHADAVTPAGDPNHTPWRLVTAMLYLNTHGADFTGGELVFPRLNQSVYPVAGRLVGFRCDAVHTHSVPAVESGTRRAVAAWFTTDPARAASWWPKRDWTPNPTCA